MLWESHYTSISSCFLFSFRYVQIFLDVRIRVCRSDDEGQGKETTLSSYPHSHTHPPKSSCCLLVHPKIKIYSSNYCHMRDDSRWILHSYSSIKCIRCSLGQVCHRLYNRRRCVALADLGIFKAGGDYR